MKKIKFLKKHKKESSKWLSRHFNDEYVIKSKKEGFRSRSSYKLIQIEEKFNFLKTRKKILDIGCAPGGWMQVARKLCSQNTIILGIDKLPIEPIQGTFFFKGDIYDDEVLKYIKTFFKSKIDLLVSDMSPNVTGNKMIDHLRIISLVERVMELTDEILENDGFIVLKIFQGGMQGELKDKMKSSLTKIKSFKPKASRKESPELYIIAKKK